MKSSGNMAFSPNASAQRRRLGAVGCGVWLGILFFALDFDNYHSFDRGIDPIADHETFSSHVRNGTTVSIGQHVVRLSKRTTGDRVGDVHKLPSLRPDCPMTNSLASSSNTTRKRVSSLTGEPLFESFRSHETPGLNSTNLLCRGALPLGCAVAQPNKIRLQLS